MVLARSLVAFVQMIFFGDQCILHQPVEEWPVCDVLIAFHSVGFPLGKVSSLMASCAEMLSFKGFRVSLFADFSLFCAS
jgi:Diphosphoinositol pentakisphosphate kinase 2 N-terminal domain